MPQSLDNVCYFRVRGTLVNKMTRSGQSPGHHFENDVNILDATLFGFSAWRIVLGFALLAVFVVLMLRSRKRKVAASASAEDDDESTHDKTIVIAPPAGAEKPAVNLTDTQRIDQLHRRLSLKAGERADLKDLTFGRLAKFNIVLAGIEHASGRDFAHIKVELGGATADCGSAVQEIGENDFLVPRAMLPGQQCSIHYMCGRADAVSYLQVQVPQINPVDGSAAIDVLHVRGRRAA